MTPEEIEAKRQENFDMIAIGKKDPNGNTVYGVYTKGDEFAIYSTDSLNTIKGIRVRIDTKDPNDDEPIMNFQSIKGEFDKLKHVSDRCTDPSYAARAAHAISVAIYGDPEEAKRILQEIYKNIEDSYKERVIGKLIYMSGTFLLAFIVCSLSLYLYLCQPPFIVQDRTIFYELVLTAAMSTLGGIISISKNINSISVDKGLGKIPYFIYGIERSIFSIVGGVFVYFLIGSNLLFGFISDLDNSIYGILVFGFLAGFSETLVPNALSNIEERANNESNK
ncbi:hypothetical protein Q4493_15540 [Colwellia sp. 1_MG-2023]|uniref:hypothetical protein n=1 Tax=Colwellia sp. 1_MG-2023 TaxID=3062649 RepID=UPI0026E45C9F|nr:hypothetical protein [Colwellia sp. 1_MG-2023]MDO6447184.1 hypothetical protein [Colwellia sp. 1_MG-2023]